MSTRSSNRSLRPLLDRAKLIVFPFILSLVVIVALSGSVYLYRAVYQPGVSFAPATPKAQRSFSFKIPLAKIRFPEGETLLLTIRKSRDSFGSTHYWHVGKTVLSLPLQVSSCGICVRLALWDPGTYHVSLADEQGHAVFSSSLSVIAPLALYRDDLLLILLIILLSWGSGKYASGVMASGLPVISQKVRGRVALGSIGLGIIAIGLTLTPYPGMNSLLQSDRTLGQSGSVISAGNEDSTFESEGRSDALPLPLFPVSTNVRSGYLSIRHHMDSWTEFGRTLTIFEGAVDDLGKKPSFFLPPDDGRYFLSLWSPDSAGKSLQNTHWVVRSIPVSPPFPVGLFAGLASFSFAGFLWGLLIRRPLSLFRQR